jgi:hypothetical protein
MVRCRTGLWFCALIVMMTLAAGCVGPARTSSDYRLKTRNSAKVALSAVETSRLAARLVREKRAFATYVSVVLDGAERDVTSVRSTYESIQPPSEGSVRLREKFDDVLSDAVSTISSMRIAARGREWNDLLTSARDLPHLSGELQKYAELPE